MSSLGAITDCRHYWKRLEAASGRRMFDVGANAGGTARMFAASFEKVFAFEPCEESFDDMQVPGNVEALNIAISDHTGLVTLREASKAIGSGQLVSDGPSLDWGETVGHREVLCMSLDDASAMYGEPDAIKVDVEGHELHVLSGGTRTIESKCARWFIEVHAADFERTIRETFADYTIELLRHSGYREGTDGWREHFYMVVTP